MNSPGAPSRLPIGSVLSIIQSAGSASVAAHALPRANLTIGQVFHSELHPALHIGFPGEGDRYRSNRLWLPWLELQLLRGSAQDERIALRRDTDVGHLTSALRARTSAWKV